MLQNNAVRTLQYDSEIRVAQQPSPSEPRVYDSHISITSQPRPEAPRIPLPVPIPTVTGSRTLIPLSGYDCLADLPSVHIEQTFELNDALTGVSSENRYVVRSPLGDAIFAASESSTEKDRLVWGAGRPFQMHLLDKTHQEALVFRKKLALGSLCCQAKSLEIWIPPGNLLGKVVQSPTFMQPEFFIEDESTRQLVFCVEGPVGSGLCCFCLPKDCYFKIHSGGNMRASIDHKWMASKSQYTTNIYFTDAKLTAKERALILGSAFLLEYLFFQTRF
ncbi:phospholipid scramblase 1 isoform X2 [Drosophila sechellia]|uniref:Phospholipid scramblase n=1 Tax=Drosophila sechellia TaxID=7238 RepID=B4HN40_DROSE|nr:phospholipid scramblase 1 isoform X2 [Drosophila sechellia]EDW47344.1 GM20472 [Drosophila sechellia]